MLASLAGRAMFVVGILILFSLFTFQAINAFALEEEFHVVQVTKNFKLSESDPSYHDYYINAGQNQGMQKGMIVPVERRLTVQDNFRKIVDDNVMIPVGKIELISVHEKVSIGRLIEKIPAKTGGVLEYQAIMTGDKVNVARAEMKKSKSADIHVESEKVVEASTDELKLNSPMQDMEERGGREISSVLRNPNGPKTGRAESDESELEVPLLTQ